MVPGNFIKSRINSFYCAFRGIYFAITTQVNYSIHFTAAVLVNLAAWYFEIAAIEWVAVWICITAVLTAETFNTAMEKMVDLVEPSHNPLAGLIKDLAAASVLFAAMGSVVVAGIIFIPRLWMLLQ